MSCYTLTIDPGTGGTGWALWNDAHKHRPDEEPDQVGVFTPIRDQPWLLQMHSVAMEIERVFRYVRGKSASQPISQLLIEWPRFMESEGGQKSATSGALVKLAAVCGAICTVAMSQGVPVLLVEVNDWKGQMSKTAVEHRVKKRLGDKWCRENLRGEHMFHAVGIGLHWKGAFGV